MSVRTLAGWSCVFALASIIVAGCSHGPARVTAPKISASSVAAKAIEQYDADHDGKLSGAELDACSSIKSALDKIDTTSDGTVTAEKLTARIQAWQKGVARIGFGCTVLHNGEPLAGADVKFVPEKFMGGSYPTGTGKTSGLGKADVTMPAIEGQTIGPACPRGSIASRSPRPATTFRQSTTPRPRWARKSPSTTRLHVPPTAWCSI